MNIQVEKDDSSQLLNNKEIANLLKVTSEQDQIIFYDKITNKIKNDGMDGAKNDTRVLRTFCNMLYGDVFLNATYSLFGKGLSLTDQRKIDAYENFIDYLCDNDVSVKLALEEEKNKINVVETKFLTVQKQQQDQFFAEEMGKVKRDLGGKFIAE